MMGGCHAQDMRSPRVCRGSWLLVCLVVYLVAASACTQNDASPLAEKPSPSHGQTIVVTPEPVPAGMRLSFMQQRIDEGTRAARSVSSRRHRAPARAAPSASTGPVIHAPAAAATRVYHNRPSTCATCCPGRCVPQLVDAPIGPRSSPSQDGHTAGRGRRRPLPDAALADRVRHPTARRRGTVSYGGRWGQCGTAARAPEGAARADPASRRVRASHGRGDPARGVGALRPARPGGRVADRRPECRRSRSPFAAADGATRTRVARAPRPSSSAPS